MKLKSQKSFKKPIRPTIAMLIVVGLVSAVALILNSRDKNYKIPDQVKKQLNFSVLYPTKPIGQWKLKSNSTKISYQENKTDKTFDFVLTSSSANVTISEQAYPDALIYDNLVNGLRAYDSVGSVHGTVSLARPQYLNGAQAAVLNYNNQALIFGKPNHDLPKSEWHNIINGLEPVK